MNDKLFKGDSRDSEKWTYLHDGGEESLADFITNITEEKNDPVVYKTPVSEENIKLGIFALADIKREFRKSSHYKCVCLENNKMKKNES